MTVSTPANQNPSANKRVALLGAGYIADWHAKALQSVGGVEIVAVCDSYLAKAEALARNFGIPGVYGSLEAMLAAENLDAVHVLTPPDRHFHSAHIVLEADVNVFLEKPMCDRVEDCDALVQLAAQRGLRIGVSHNFLFADVYEKLRRDIRSGVLGVLDDITITWHRGLPQAVHGPFDTWMLRDPHNILIEVGSHSIAHMLHLIGVPEELTVHASNAITLPTGKPFYRHWQVDGLKGRTAVHLRFSFVSGFPEYSIRVRGSLASATADFEFSTYTLDQHLPSDPDFETHGIVVARAKSLKKQARRTLWTYIESKAKLTRRGSPYGVSIARAMDAFYSSAPLDERISGHLGAQVIRVCKTLGQLANLPADEPATVTGPDFSSAANPEEPAPLKGHDFSSAANPEEPASLKGHDFSRATNGEKASWALAPEGTPPVLVLGGAGFIGKELLRQLIASGHNVRALVRSTAAIPADLRASPNLELVRGDLGSNDDLLRAMQGVDTVLHLARANVKTWADYRQFEIEASRRVAECALQAAVKRFVYTGTIDSYYAGAAAGTITEATPLDPKIEQRNLYARAKAESERILLRMHREQGLPLVIVRPGIVIGRGGSPFHWGVGMWWHDAVCQVWGKGENKLPLVLVEDVAGGLVSAMGKPGIDGRSFNLAADPCLSAQEYLDELDRCGGMRVERRARPILRFYLTDLMKWAVKVAVRHPERRMPSYRDWESRTQCAHFDCTAAKTVLGWQPASERGELVRRGIEEPLREFLL